MTGDDECRGSRVDLLDLLNDLDSVLPLHPQVHDDQIEMLTLNFIEPLAPAARCGNFVAMVLQVSAHGFENCFLIIDQQNRIVFYDPEFLRKEKSNNNGP
ncbi:MAG: hypothetical protein VYC17_06485 [Nitrospinota bacterium]|nr:hypothetical protein [Nitrospinota bacterium]